MPDEFRRPLSRKTFAFSLLAAILTKVLARIGQRHLAERRPQVAVLAFDHVGHEINLNGIYESYQLDTLADWLVQRGYNSGTALDVGANIGNHSLFLSNLYAEVLAFEPNPRVFALLKLNAGLAPNIRVYNYALSDTQADAVALDVRPANIGASGLRFGPGQEGAHIERVVVRRLDDLEAVRASPIRLIKIDVEGHELNVLRGARSTIHRHQPIVLFEANASSFVEGNSPVVDLLRSYGYSTFAVVGNYPRVPSALPGWFRVPCTIAARLVWGFGFSVTEVSGLPPANYSMIVAIPPGLTTAPRS